MKPYSELSAQPNLNSMEEIIVKQDRKQWSSTLFNSPQGIFLKVQPLDTKVKSLNVEITALPDSKKLTCSINLYWTFDDSSKEPYWVVRLDAYRELIPEGDILHISLTEASTESCMNRGKVDKLHPIESRFIRVDGKLIPVSKEVLSLFSPNYFRKLFYNEGGRVFKEPDQTVVDIKDQNYEDMKFLLECSMQFRSQPPSDSDACNFFHLCNMFDLQSLLERSKSYLINSALSASSEVKARIIDMAELYGDDDLMTHVFSTFECPTDFSRCISLMPRALSPTFSASLIEKYSQKILKCEQPKRVFLQFATGRITINIDHWLDRPEECEHFLQFIRGRKPGHAVRIQNKTYNFGRYIFGNQYTFEYKVTQGTTSWIFTRTETGYGMTFTINLGYVVEGENLLNQYSDLRLEDCGVVHNTYVSYPPSEKKY